MATKSPAPAFTPPSIQVSATPVANEISQARVRIVDGDGRYYSAIDSSAEAAMTRVLETALHAEYQRLEQQRALVRGLRARWLASKQAVAP